MCSKEKRKKYDLICLFKGDLTSEEIEATIKSLFSIGSSEDLKILDADYTGLVSIPVDKYKRSGHLYSFLIELNTEILTHLESKLNFLQNIYKYINLNLEDKEDFRPKFNIPEKEKDGVSRLISSDTKYRDVAKKIITENN